MKENNKGFTFIELIVGMVIFALIAAAALGFLVAASNTYGSVNGAMSQRLEAQLAVNQLSEYLIDCNGSVSFKDNTLSIISTDGEGKTVTDIFRFDAGDNTLYFGAQGAQAELAKNVTAFSVSLEPAGALNADWAKITLTTEKRGKELVTERTVAFRNKPMID